MQAREAILSAVRARPVKPTWEQVDGHNGERWNELCDAPAVQETFA
jgi:ribonuclease HI